MNFTSVAFNDVKKRVASINVVVPTHVTKATLTNPDRQEVSVMTMCLVGTPEDNPDYTVSEDGFQLVLTQAVPQALMNKNKMFSSKRLGQVLADIWQGAYLESKDAFFENFNLEEGDAFVFKQVIDLPIQVMQNKRHDHVHLFQLEENTGFLLGNTGFGERNSLEILRRRSWKCLTKIVTVTVKRILAMLVLATLTKP